MIFCSKIQYTLGLVSVCETLVGLGAQVCPHATTDVASRPPTLEQAQSHRTQPAARREKTK